MDELLDTWMDLGPTVAPSRIAEATRDEIRITHQRRVTWWPARRFPIMNNTKVRFGLAAAAVIVIALLGIRFLPNNVAGPGVTPHSGTHPHSDPSTERPGPAASGPDIRLTRRRSRWMLVSRFRPAGLRATHGFWSDRQAPRNRMGWPSGSIR